MIINQIIHFDMKKYQSNLTDNQWKVLQNYVDVKRKREHDLRDIFDGIFYLLKTGCQWRMLPKDFAPWNTVYYYYRKWKLEGIIELIHEKLPDMVREKAGRKTSPSAGLTVEV